MEQSDAYNGEDPSDPIGVAVARRDAQTLDMVQAAILSENVLLAYQPVVQANDPSRVAFHEGLIRVIDPGGRVIPARHFVGAAETLELGRQIDCQALSMGLQALAEHEFLRLSINMSARSVGYEPWVRTLEEGLARSSTVAERLILEITESSAIVMPDVVSFFMRRLQARGISFALDDFGSGYTAFRHLRDLYFDIVKIDGQFIRNIHADPDNQILAQALVSISRHFDMFTVAESVERAADADFLREIGVDCLQGYYFGAPTTRPAWQTPKASLRQA